MEKFTILCGMANRDIADLFMKEVLISLRNDEVYPVTCDWRYLTFETKYTRVGFIYDISKQPLNGVEATAIFGKEPYKQTLAPYLKTGHAYKMGDGLVDYIRKMETEGKYREACENYDEQIKKMTKLVEVGPDVVDVDVEGVLGKHIYITQPRHSGKTAMMKELMNSQYGTIVFDSWNHIPKDVFVEYSKNDVDGTHHLWRNFKNYTYGRHIPSIKDVIFNNPATIIFWADGTKTVVECQDEPYDPEKGLAMAMCKKMLGNKRDYYHTFKHWLKKCKEK
jgi:hypothetical protein